MGICMHITMYMGITILTQNMQRKYFLCLYGKCTHAGLKDGWGKTVSFTLLYDKTIGI